MKQYVAAALMIGIGIGPASALDKGVGASVGGIGVGAGVNAGSQGASVGVGASVGDAGGSHVGASVGAGKGSVGVGVGASGNVGNASGGVSTSIGAGDDPAADNGSPTASGSPATTPKGTAGPTAAASARSGKQSIALPPILKPSISDGGFTDGYPVKPQRPLRAKPGIPAAVVQACRSAITSAATPLGAVRVRALSAGLLRRRGGTLTAPIKVQIDYARQGGVEVRQADVDCRLDRAGRVTAIK
ncbi:hypothetical protein LB524_16500 [Mesorhizobium sp. ESP6-5]|uniref:hypothetical protein n=1 Tax=Mesorhizobium sp. ESP6-5 TaxID=2876623 RepID=UPI001CCB0DC8|nr:hypothetical protein [Mesorhizobium sp. ESP6-5]MBZ9756894.1 hypothetical protein [Mesorhizobium sp. ESP6-5]